MSPQKNIPYGQWCSPISAAYVAEGARSLSQVRIVGADAYWLESRPSENGRITLVSVGSDGIVQECIPTPFNVRSRVHEYGGAAYLPIDRGAVSDGVSKGAHNIVRSIVFSHFADNGLYLQVGNNPAIKLTSNSKHRFVDFVHDEKRARFIAVREDHSAVESQAINTICGISLDGADEQKILVQGDDFYAAPRLSPDGRKLAWLSWNQPNMPWTGTELWLADVLEDGVLDTPRMIAGGESESICQPEWSPDGHLYFVSDRSAWWNLYRHEEGGAVPLCPMSAEFGSPHWQFGKSMYGFFSASEIVCTYIENGVSRIARIHLEEGTLQNVDVPYTDIQDLRVGSGGLLLIAGSPTIPLEIVRINLKSGLESAEREVLARSITNLPASKYLSVPNSVHFASGEAEAHGFYYPPANPDYAASNKTKPPLIVISHGGPTGMASSTLKLSTQYWTSRGFAVLDVNYRGSSGFGRAYQDALKGNWGIVDVEDCVNGACYAVKSGLADPNQLIMRGSSAGGFTTLSALAFHDVFKVGAIYYGVSDLKAIDQDSHKFESHYNSYLIAPAPLCEQRYLERSPIHHVDRLNKPMIFFQGLDDKVVPPQQSESIVNGLKGRGVHVAYVTFTGEGHGFRKASSIQYALEKELQFYCDIFGIKD